MVSELRKEVILETLGKKGVLYTSDIMKKCNVSEITIRRDLIDLESKGLLVRTHGGAIKSKTLEYQLFSYDLKINKNRQHKELICKLAAGYIRDHDIVFIDCGTTLSFLTQFIVHMNLTVITNSLPVVSDLISVSNIRLSLIGGEIASERQAIYGPLAERSIDYYHVNKAFIGADGISLQNGLSSYDEKEAAITRKMMENADEVFLLCDSSKIEKNSYVRFAPLSKVHHLITDKGMSGESVSLYKGAAVDVIAG
ncbi:MAG: DeoR/GlpR family DNA-binding transcription regulator [Tannerella sp.]|jgi:DeoR family fructose operon transcriptional repressor|nr:DeoR/GlpR family DNA-binding transcription regulator [Tannerella sp.]